MHFFKTIHDHAYQDVVVEILKSIVKYLPSEVIVLLREKKIHQTSFYYYKNDEVKQVWHTSPFPLALHRPLIALAEPEPPPHILIVTIYDTGLWLFPVAEVQI